MKVINLFRNYFLILIVIEGIVLGFFDARSFENSGMKKVAKKARILGRGVIIVGILLYLIRIVLV